MVVCHAHSLGVTPEETMGTVHLSPQTEGGPLVTLMDRNVAHPRTRSYSSRTLGANNDHVKARGPRGRVQRRGGGHHHALAALSQLTRCPVKCFRPAHAASHPPVNKVSSQVYEAGLEGSRRRPPSQAQAGTSGSTLQGSCRLSHCAVINPNINLIVSAGRRVIGHISAGTKTRGGGAAGVD